MVANPEDRFSRDEAHLCFAFYSSIMVTDLMLGFSPTITVNGSIVEVMLDLPMFAIGADWEVEYDFNFLR